MPPPSSIWVIPGAPLENGEGWKIWYSWRGGGRFDPAPIEVEHDGHPQRFTPRWDALPAVAGVDRKAGISTIRLDDPLPGGRYTVTIPEAGKFAWSTLADDLQEGTTFLVTSCFWRNDDLEGRYGAALTHLTTKLTPAFKLLIGDQLYQDWPIVRELLTNQTKAYAARYETYWGDRVYQQALQTTPNLFACDDHEFWNNFPERQPQLPWTWRGADRDANAQLARDLYDLFEGKTSPTGKRYFDFKVGRVSFFVSDSRSRRTARKSPGAHFFEDDQWKALDEWVDGLVGPGVLVLSQPLYQDRGDWKDYSLANFEADQARLCSLFERAIEGSIADNQPHDILILTGDIHTGRHSKGNISGHPGVDIHEFVASPASLVRPHGTFKKVSSPPGKLSPKDRPHWIVEPIETTTFPTTQNNVAAVRMSEGTNGRVRFELESWRVRPFDDRSFWKRHFTRARQPTGPIIPLYRKEVELR